MERSPECRRVAHSVRDRGARFVGHVALGDSVTFGEGDVGGASFVGILGHLIEQHRQVSVAVHNAGPHAELDTNSPFRYSRSMKPQEASGTWTR